MYKLDLKKFRSGLFLPDDCKGTYVLLLSLDLGKDILIGRGRNSFHLHFRAGYYAYVGSAHGPGGLKSRINRHLKKEKKYVWHIDYLRKEAQPVEMWVDVHEKKLEKLWADALIAMKGSQPVENFGNTDDRRSRTHLYYFDHQPSFHVFGRLVSKMSVAS